MEIEQWPDEVYECPETAKVFHEFSVRRKVGPGWVRAQMRGMEVENNKLRLLLSINNIEIPEDV